MIERFFSDLEVSLPVGSFIEAFDEVRLGIGEGEEQEAGRLILSEVYY